jgi:DNA-binding CsgD family transcriptional regulator
MPPGEGGALAALGLSTAEQAAYELLVDQPSATLNDLAATWARPERLEGILAVLENRGLISAAPGVLPRYTAIAPAAAFQSLLLDSEDQLNAARRHLAALDAAYQERPVEREAATIVEVVTGDRSVRLRLAQIRRGVRQEVRCLDRPPYVDTDGSTAGAADLLHRGVVYRTIYDRSSLDHPGSLAAVEDLINAGQQARVLPQLPLKLYLADDRLAFLPLTGKAPGYEAAIIVHPSALLDGLNKLFEGLWQRALPLHSPAGSPAGPPAQRARSSLSAQQRLVTLLLSGLTDEAIARQLGLSYRSVQRRVAALMGELGAHTRFQAGAQAALRGYPGTER